MERRKQRRFSFNFFYVQCSFRYFWFMLLFILVWFPNSIRDRFRSFSSRLCWCGNVKTLVIKGAFAKVWFTSLYIRFIFIHFFCFCSYFRLISNFRCFANLYHRLYIFFFFVCPNTIITYTAYGQWICEFSIWCFFCMPHVLQTTLLFLQTCSPYFFI